MVESKERGWKIVFIRAFGLGSGFAVVCLVSVGAWLWKSSRPRPVARWNRNAITATYDFVAPAGEPQHLVFAYTIQNNTDADYQLGGQENIELVERLGMEGSIYRPTGEALEIRFPVFVPAGGRTTFLFDDPSKYAGRTGNSADPERHRTEAQKFVKENYSNINGFILFDHVRRYEIDLPKGW